MSVSVLQTPIKSRALGEVASKVKTAETFLIDNLLSARRYRASAIVDINYMYGAHRLAPLVERDSQVPRTSGIERRLTSIRIPRFAVMREIGFNEIDQTSLQAFASLSDESRNRAAQQIIRSEVQYATNRLYRSVEQLLGQLISGTAPSDFKLGTIESHAADVNWGDTNNPGNVVNCVRDMKLKALRKVGGGTDVKFFGIYNSSVGKKLLANSSYINYFATSFYGLNSVSRPFANYQNVQSHGVMEGVQLVQYDEVFVALNQSNDTTFSPIIPNDTFLLVAVTPNNALYWTHAPNSESLDNPDLVFIKQENDYSYGRETIRIVAEINAFPFVDADGIIKAIIS
jgi:hypothetical protein